MNYFPNTDTPEEIRRRVDELKAKPPGEIVGGHRELEDQLERAELAERYEQWPGEWREFYAGWRRDNEG